MKYVVLGCLSAALSFTVAIGAEAAPAKASTKELPAALKALGGTQSKILTSSQARQIRGQGSDKIPPASRNNGGNFRGYKPGNNPH